MRKTKMLGIIGILMGLMLIGSLLAGPAFAGGKKGAANGNSENSNDFAVCHETGKGNFFTLWLDAEGHADHIAHGDADGVCA